NRPRPSSSGCSWDRLSCRTAIRAPPGNVLSLMLLSRSLQRLLCDRRLAQQCPELIIGDRQHLHRTAFGGPDRGGMSLLVEKFDLAKILTRSKLQRNNIGLILTGQNHLHCALRYDVEAVCVRTFREDHGSRFIPLAAGAAGCLQDLLLC